MVLFGQGSKKTGVACCRYKQIILFCVESSRGRCCLIRVQRRLVLYVQNTKTNKQTNNKNAILCVRPCWFMVQRKPVFLVQDSKKAGVVGRVNKVSAECWRPEWRRIAPFVCVCVCVCGNTLNRIDVILLLFSRLGSVGDEW